MIHCNSILGEIIEEIYVIVFNFFNKKGIIKNFKLIKESSCLEYFKSFIAFFFSDKDMNNFDSILEDSNQQMKKIIAELEMKKIFLNLPFVKCLNYFKKIEYEFSHFISNIDKMFLFQIQYPSLIEIIQYKYFTLIQSKIFQKVMHLEFCKLKEIDFQELKFMEFGNISMSNLSKIIHSSYDFIQNNIFTGVDATTLLLKDIFFLFGEINIYKELQIFSTHYTQYIKDIFEFYKILQISTKINEFSSSYRGFFDFFSIKNVAESLKIFSLSKFTNFEDDIKITEIKKQLNSILYLKDKVHSKVSKTLHKCSDILLLIKIFSDSPRIIKFVWTIFQDYYNHSDAQIDVMNEEIQKGGYQVKNIHLIYVKQLLRFLKLISQKSFNSDYQLFAYFNKRYQEEASIVNFEKEISNKILKEFLKLIFQNSLFDQSYSSKS